MWVVRAVINWVSLQNNNHSIAYLVVEPVSCSAHYENVLIIISSLIHLSAIGVTLAIVFILLVSNFTIINVQQQLTGQPGQLLSSHKPMNRLRFLNLKKKLRYWVYDFFFSNDDLTSLSTSSIEFSWGFEIIAPWKLLSLLKDNANPPTKIGIKNSDLILFTRRSPALMKRVNLAQDFSQTYARNGKNRQKLQGMLA